MHQNISNSREDDTDIKKEVRDRFHRIYRQLTQGCGKVMCKNLYCASSPYFCLGNISKSDLAAFAMNVLKRHTHEELYNFKICRVVEKISLERYRKLASETENQDRLKSLVFSQFSNSRTLELSFTNKGVGKSELLNLRNESEIDFSELLETYEWLIRNPVVRMHFEKSMLPSSKSVCKVMAKIKYAYELRSLIILFMNPLLKDVNKEEVFTLISGMKLLNKSYKDLIVEWMVNFPKEAILMLVELINQYILIEAYSCESDLISEEGKGLMEFMKMIKVSNDISGLVHFSVFYNDAINDKLSSRRSLSKFVKSLKSTNSFDFYFLFDPAIKSKILLEVSQKEQDRMFSTAILSSIMNGSRKSPYLSIVVSRDTIVRDTLNQLNQHSSYDYKKPLRVSFKGEFGVDEGGVKKEFFQLIVRQLFLPEYGMFEQNETTRLYWFNKDSLDTNSEFGLIGLIIGLAIYNGVILNLRFPKIVYQKLLDVPVYSLAHLETVDPALANGLRNLLEFEGDVEKEFGTTFALEYESFGEIKTVELKPGGKNVRVNNDNRKEYVSLYIDYVLNQSIKEKFHYFYKGLHAVCSSDVFSWFHWEELELLVCGKEELDFHALEKSCKYQDGYTQSSQTVKYFWEVLHSLDEEQKKKFLAFTTGSDRVPIRGLGDLVLTILKNGSDQNRLPSAHTCFNYFLLPEYTSKERLEEKLKLAIENAEGFGLL